MSDNIPHLWLFLAIGFVCLGLLVLSSEWTVYSQSNDAEDGNLPVGTVIGMGINGEAMTYNPAVYGGGQMETFMADVPENKEEGEVNG